MTYQGEDRESASQPPEEEMMMLEGNIMTVVRDSEIEQDDGSGSSEDNDDQNPLDIKFVKADVAVKSLTKGVGDENTSAITVD